MSRTKVYLLLWISTILLAGCSGASSSSNGNPPSQVSVSISPTSASLNVGQSQQFGATVTGTSNSSVTWAVNGTMGGNSTIGTVSTSGLYTAPATPPNPASVSVSATSVADSTKSATASVTITSQASGTVTVSPSQVSVEVFRSQQFNAAINGQATTAVTWQVNGVTGGNTTTGTVSTAGLYSAPHSISNSIIPANGAPVTVQITAVSTANASNAGSATVTLTVPNQSTQTTPIELGTSGSNANDSVTNGKTITCCGGTLGSLVKNGSTNYILSNAHVLGRSGAAPNGDPIIQPGLIDTGTCTSQGATTVANLTAQSFTSQGAGTSNVDAAIAQVVSGTVDPAGNILQLGSGTDANGVPLPGAPCTQAQVCGLGASVNLTVAKSGRTTGLTCSAVSAINAVTTVDYYTACGSTTLKFSVTYNNQVSVQGGDFSGSGDSGSLIVNESTADPVALLYAGSDVDTVGNPVADVLHFFASGGNAISFVGGNQHSVIGCTLPGPQAAMAARLVVKRVPASSESMRQASMARDAHAPEMLAHLEVEAVGVGPSFDSPGEAAIVLFVLKGLPRSSLPKQLDGIRTRIVEGDYFPVRGLLTPEESEALEQSAAAPRLFYSISDAEVARAKVVQAAHMNELMKQPGIQGVGITSSADAPGEAALMIFVVRGVARNPTPVLIDGLRTRIRESSRFTAGQRGTETISGCRVPPPVAAATPLQP